MLNQVRDVRGAQKGKPELILRVVGLGLLLCLDRERSGIERGVAARPEEGAMGLVGLEAAEIAKTASATAASATAASTPSEATAASKSSSASKSPASTKASSTASSSTASSAASSGSAALSASTSWTALAAASGKRLVQLRIVAKLLHVHSGEGIGRACLSGDSDRFGGEVRVIGE